MAVVSEERIGAALAILRESESGRMGQQQLKLETGYSKSSISQIVSELESRGKVKVIPLGRSNLVCLPDSVPEAATPPRMPEEESHGD